MACIAYSSPIYELITLEIQTNMIDNGYLLRTHELNVGNETEGAVAIDIPGNILGLYISIIKTEGSLRKSRSCPFP